MARSIKDLINHMNKFKDAAVIIGPKAIDALQKKITSEEIETNFTKKSLRRNPDSFWKFFEEKVFINPAENVLTDAQSSVITLNHLGVVKTVIDLNADGLIAFNTDSLTEYIPLHGCNLVFKCQKCKTLYSHQAAFDDNFKINNTKCETCGGDLRPTTIIPGENYDDNAFHAVKEALFNSHTLILVGMDFGEEPIVDLIAKFGDMKSMATKEEDKRMLVAVTEKECELDLNELTFFEFIVKDNIDSAMIRLVKAFRE